MGTKNKLGEEQRKGKEILYFREADDRVLVLQGSKELVGSYWKYEWASSGK